MAHEVFISEPAKGRTTRNESAGIRGGGTDLEPWSLRRRVVTHGVSARFVFLPTSCVILFSGARLAPTLDTVGASSKGAGGEDSYQVD